MTADEMLAECRRRAPGFTIGRELDPDHGWVWVARYERRGKTFELSHVDSPGLGTREIVIRGCLEMFVGEDRP